MKRPQGIPDWMWADPLFRAELSVFRKRHGGNTPVRITRVEVPDGFPKFLTAYGTSSCGLYETPKQSRRGKFYHPFGRAGRNKPWLVSSAARGPKFLAFVGGSFRAKTKWLHD